jgi:Animal haem peroxidase
MKRKRLYCVFAAGFILISAYPLLKNTDFGSCLTYAFSGFRDVASDRADRFLGKVRDDTARCRGGDLATAGQMTPWVDWPRYWGAAGQESVARGIVGRLGFLSPNRRGINGTLLDLEYQRIELLKFNLYDNSGTYEEYTRSQADPTNVLEKTWPQFRFSKDHPLHAAVGGDGTQRCGGALVRFRTATGICNDILNPLMGSTDQPFARNVSFESTFPEFGLSELTKNRHGKRLGLLTPDPQVISRKLFTRRQSSLEKCSEGGGLPRDQTQAECDYKKAPHINGLAAFWIQFMTHDWFSHLDEGRNQPKLISMGCQMERANDVDRQLTPEAARLLGCRPEDRIDKSFIADDVPAPTFNIGDKTHMARAPRTTWNKVTAWWDASQIYGYDDNSRRRVSRDSRDPAKLALESIGAGMPANPGYLPLLRPSDALNPQWAGQESVAFPDNWNIGLSFFHNVFAREHNLFVEEFRRRIAATPESDSGLRHPARPSQPIRYNEVTDDELFEVARLVVAAEIAKIHTIEWTPQMLYNEPVYLAMNANWSGLLQNHPLASAALEKVIEWFARSEKSKRLTEWYSAFAAGPGIFGLGNNSSDINSGVNHFGSPFNFPEEFVNAYRLHAMLPDLIEFRDITTDPNAIQSKIPVVETVRGKATQAMRRYGIANWALSMGRQRAGQLTLQNHPLFLQNLDMPRLKSATGKIDVLALDIIRDRERGIPRYNEFRRQYGLKQLTGFADFIDSRLPKDSMERTEQQRLAALLREVYGQHKCEETKVITDAQKNPDGTPINDCLGHPNDAMVDNIEDVDALVGWLAEPVRPHGFAISETQFQIFILNASRRLFSDRFLTSSFRREFYSDLGVKWVNENGPDGKVMEKRQSNGHEIEVSPLKRVLLRTIPELKSELEPVVNVFDPWARDRGEYYSLQWKSRPGAETDPAFNPDSAVKPNGS